MAKITDQPISPELIINQVKTSGSGCVATYVGFIRDNSQGKSVLSVEYSDTNGTAEKSLQQIVNEARSKWQVNEMTIYHRIGILKVGDINLVVAVAAAHREEGFAACQYAVDRFKEKLPTHKKETYTDNTHLEDG
ncbi:MAG: molybdenum cofactor biosynthesis protein MoaE [Dehalococcoidia bacterium]|nr:MAG: molybdenum cofactor biosynthesis protein MoaE [Dehalococcoidia bacterium]